MWKLYPISLIFSTKIRLALKKAIEMSLFDDLRKYINGERWCLRFYKKRECAKSDCGLITESDIPPLCLLCICIEGGEDR